MKPLIVLDEKTGEGGVLVSEEFAFMSSLQQADLLVDWIETLVDMTETVTEEGTFLTDLAPRRFKELQ